MNIEVPQRVSVVYEAKILHGRLMERRARMTPLGRCVTAEDVAATIVSLVMSNPFVTGEVVVVDGATVRPPRAAGAEQPAGQRLPDRRRGRR